MLAVCVDVAHQHVHLTEWTAGGFHVRWMDWAEWTLRKISRRGGGESRAAMEAAR